jgi:uncharacterized membrane protein (DUF2068 family)
MAGAKRDTWITVIGIGKLMKAITLVAIGVLALAMADGREGDALHHWAARAGVSPGNHVLHMLIAKASGLDHKTLHAIGLGTFIYAALFLVEGIGLLMKKRWAEYFTVIITGSFVPLEIVETARHFSAFRVVGTLLNVAAVVYLVWHLRHTRKGERRTSRAHATAAA